MKRLPNILTTLRIFLSLLFFGCLIYDSFISLLIGVGIFGLAILSDYADGVLARRFQWISSYGKIMDPIADKVLILGALFIFAYQKHLSLWIVVLIAIREIGITLYRLWKIQQGSILPAENLGKWKTTFQMIGVSLLIVMLLIEKELSVQWNIQFIADIYFVFVLILTYVSAYPYVAKGKR